eukprot:15463424-Alexandrium_andersonii.AAC.1
MRAADLRRCSADTCETARSAPICRVRWCRGRAQGTKRGGGAAPFRAAAARTLQHRVGGRAVADPSACTEPRGLAPSRPELCPADVLISAASGGLTALDVGVAAPSACGAGKDCCEALGRRKLRDYAPTLDELAAQGI